MENAMSDTQPKSRVWPALAVAGIAAAVCAAWLREKTHHREALAARERARLVPLRQARMEAAWTRQAVSYAGGAKGG